MDKQNVDYIKAGEIQDLIDELQNKIAIIMDLVLVFRKNDGDISLRYIGDSLALIPMCAMLSDDLFRGYTEPEKDV